MTSKMMDAFAQRCDEEGKTMSEVIRSLIGAYIRETP